MRSKASFRGHPIWHGSQFDVKTGGLKAGPSNEGIATFRVDVDKSDVLLFI